jgi:hypothetical protein
MEWLAMERADADCATLAETTVFLSYFKDLQDHRQAGKVFYPLDEISTLCLLAVLAGADAFADIACLARRKWTYYPFLFVTMRRRAVRRGGRAGAFGFFTASRTALSGTRWRDRRDERGMPAPSFTARRP